MSSICDSSSAPLIVQLLLLQSRKEIKNFYQKVKERRSKAITLYKAIEKEYIFKKQNIVILINLRLTNEKGTSLILYEE